MSGQKTALTNAACVPRSFHRDHCARVGKQPYQTAGWGCVRILIRQGSSTTPNLTDPLLREHNGEPRFLYVLRMNQSGLRQPDIVSSVLK